MHSGHELFGGLSLGAKHVFQRRHPLLKAEHGGFGFFGALHGGFSFGAGAAQGQVFGFQGLNLGLKDVAALVDVIADAGKAGMDIGAESALEPYTRWRRADVAARPEP